MIKIFKYVALSFMVTTMLITPQVKNTVNANTNQFNDGIYFHVSQNNGAYYSFLEWRKLSPKERGQIISLYNPNDIIVYLDPNVASLGTMVSKRQKFLDASVSYSPGSIPGNYIDKSTGKIIGQPTDNTDFEIIRID